MKTGSLKLKQMHPLESLGLTPATRGDIRVERLQDRLIPKIPFPHKHDFFQIVIIHSASGWHEVDFHKHKVKANQVYLIKPGQVHGWKLPKSTKGFIIEYTVESLPPEKNGNLAQQSRHLPDLYKFSKACKSLQPSFVQLMESEYLQKAPLHEACLQNYLQILLLELLRTTAAKKTLSTEDLTVQFTDLVETHYRQEHNVQFYAQKLKITPKILSGKIQKSLGKPAKEIILQRCLLEAKRLLSYSNLSISEIGYELGFEDPNYFSRFLKNNMRISAVKFRSTKKNP